MLPLIIAGGAVLGGVAFLGIKEKCSKCDSLWTMNETCLICGQNVCGDCGVDTPKIIYKDWPISPKGRCCKVHQDDFNQSTAKYKSAIDASESVEIISKNFKGKVPAPSRNKSIETQFHTDKDDAERELKILAAFNSAFQVQQVEYSKEKRHDGNYTYTVWKASGLI